MVSSSFVFFLDQKEKFNNAMDKVINSYEHRGLRFDPIQWIKDFIAKAIEKIFELILKNADGGIGIDKASSRLNIFVYIIILAVIVILLIICGKMLMNRKKKKNLNSIFGEKITEETTFESLDRKSQELAEHNKFRDAIRVGFVSVLFKMHQEGVLTLEECKTTKEIRESLEASEFNIKEFHEAASLFNSVWYGFKANEEKYDKWMVLKDKILQEVRKNEKEI